MRFFLIFLVFATVCSCQKKDDLFSELSKRSMEGKETIAMTDIVLGDWDQGCYFSYGLSKTEVEKILGIQLPGSLEFVERLVFIKGRSIVKYSELEYTPSKPSQISLKDSTGSPHFCFYRTNSQFSVQANEIDGKNFYDLVLR